MFIRNIHRNMRMNLIRENLRCETEEQLLPELLQTKEEGTRKLKQQAILDSKGTLALIFSWKLPVLKRCQKKCIETGTKMEPVHKDH